MFAINKRSGRKINRVTFVEVWHVVESAFEHGEGLEFDQILNSEVEGPSRTTPRASNTYWDDGDNECSRSDLELVDALPAGYDDDGLWIGRVSTLDGVLEAGTPEFAEFQEEQCRERELRRHHPHRTEVLAEDWQRQPHEEGGRGGLPSSRAENTARESLWPR